MVHDHPLREALLDELHAREAPRITTPATVLGIALKRPHQAAQRDREEDLGQLSALAGGAAFAPGTKHAAFTRDGWRVLWESHTEFTSYTAVAESPGAPFETAPEDAFPAEWERADPAVRIAAVRVEVLPMPATEAELVSQTSQWLSPERTIINQVGGSGLVLAGDFRTDADGFMRFVLFVPPDVGPGRTGRAVQWVLDLETYRAMAMIGFIRASEVGAQLNAIDPRLADLVDHLDNSERPNDEVLHELLSIVGELEALAMTHDFRFGATAAYDAIVEARIAALAEDRFDGRRTMGEFLSRRYSPAIRTVESTQERLHRTLQRSGRAADLLRTRVDVSRAAQNQALLTNMDRRAETQMRLQRAVEGLSFLAISYYTVSLLAYVLTPFAGQLGLSKGWLLAGLVPVVVVAVWIGMRALRKRIHRLTHRS
ncbi:DUF3422 family protein [Barrientosiimonas humi]|uniref:DUF3422 family protein n=1 Tax=Barrientosiimonas humi TaxID=999931 RepID=UPI00370D4184